jgi:dinuclear metal center YbgI/SA1388 family protein
MATLKQIADYLDRELRIHDFKDSSHNGVQVQNSGRVRKICTGVDGSAAFLEAARARGADLVIVHHGISWGSSLSRITELNYLRVGYLIRNDMALYAVHLPLDAHPRLGNNAQICKALGLKQWKPFGLHDGQNVGFQGRFATPVPYGALKTRIRSLLGGEIQTMDFGRPRIRTMAVVSGGAPGDVMEAGRLGLDLFLTGEPSLACHNAAQEYRLHAVFGGHYATEVFGVRALCNVIQRRFGIPCEFIDLKIPY